MTTETVVTASQPLVRAERNGGVATLTLNRGERFNPLSSAMIAALSTELEGLRPTRRCASSC